MLNRAENQFMAGSEESLQRICARSLVLQLSCVKKVVYIHAGGGLARLGPMM